MPKERKTKAEKIRAQYRLANFSLQMEESAQRRDREEFGYLASNYVVKDLAKTGVFTLVMIALLLIAKKYLG